jgi:hypothetical protein
VIGGLNNNAAAETAVQPSQTPVAPVAVEPEAPKPTVATVVKPNRTERKEEKRTKPEVKNETEAVAAAQPVKEPVKEPEPEPQTSQSIKVVMQIENGRVLKASIANPKPGMDNYEALALRIARQRRYPTTTNGGQTVTINVTR